MTSLVSIIIPAYNQEKFVIDTLNSVKNQKYKNYECIIIDDGSTDNTGLLIKDFIDKNKDERFYYFYQKNKGLAGARNTGIRYANGKYLVFLDSDDLIMKNFLEIMTPNLDTNKYLDLLNCAWCLIDEAGKQISNKIGPVRCENYFNCLIFENLFPVHSIMLRKSIFDKESYFNENLTALEDWELWLRLAYKGYKFGSVDFLGVAYRRQSESMTLDIGRMENNLKNFIDIFYGENKKLVRYRDYTYLYQLTNIFLYAEEKYIKFNKLNYKKFGKKNRIKSDESKKELITKDWYKDWNKEYKSLYSKIYSIIDKLIYDNEILVKYYEILRNIKNKKIKISILKKILSKSPKKFKNFWLKKLVKNIIKF